MNATLSSLSNRSALGWLRERDIDLLACSEFHANGAPTRWFARRKEYAEATRQAIVEAARHLFCERGYFSTKVDEIAALARVAPATVYAVSGGKQGLLHALIETGTGDPMVAATIRNIEEMNDPRAILRLVAATVRRMRAEYADVVRVMLTTAPHDQAAAEILASATVR
jgi:AcrR family transcriptional regulator